MPRTAACKGADRQALFRYHPPPHVHIYAERVGHPGVQAPRFSIETGDLIDGTLPAAKLAAATNWCRRHREALSVDWGRAQLDLHPTGRYDSS